MFPVGLITKLGVSSPIVKKGVFAGENKFSHLNTQKNLTMQLIEQTKPEYLLLFLRIFYSKKLF